VVVLVVLVVVVLVVVVVVGGSVVVVVVVISGYDVQYPLEFSQDFALDAERNGPAPERPPITLDKLINDGSDRSSDLKNPTEAVSGNGVGWLSSGTDCAITYPRSSSGPFHHSRPVASNPTVGNPTAKEPTWIVPVIPVPGLYANGLAVLTYCILFVYYIS
jgi:hypothetical protein